MTSSDHPFVIGFDGAAVLHVLQRRRCCVRERAPHDLGVAGGLSCPLAKGRTQTAVPRPQLTAMAGPVAHRVTTLGHNVGTPVRSACLRPAGAPGTGHRTSVAMRLSALGSARPGRTWVAGRCMSRVCCGGPRLGSRTRWIPSAEVNLAPDLSIY